MKKTCRPWAILIALLILTGGCLLPATHPQAAYAKGKTYEYYYTVPFKYAAIFHVKNTKYWGVCCNAGTPASPGVATGRKLSRTNKMARVAYYYGVHKKWYKDHSGSYPYKHTHLKWMLQYMGASSAASFKAAGNYGDSTVKYVKEHIDTALERCEKTPPEFECMKFDTKNHQDFIAWYMRDTGKMRVKKTSAVKSTLTDDDYNLTGATIIVREKSKKGEIVHTFKANKNNRQKDGTYLGDWFKVVKGVDYYFYETDPGKAGYEQLKGVIKAVRGTNKPKTVTISNPPQGGSVSIQKVTTQILADMANEGDDEGDDEGDEDEEAFFPEHDLEGITFRVYKVTDKGDVEVGRLTTDSEGNTEAMLVDPGDYYVVEDPADNPDLANRGFSVDGAVRSETKTVTTENVQFEIFNPDGNKSFSVKKEVRNAGGAGPEGFHFYLLDGRTEERVAGPAVTGADGLAHFENVPYGDYIVEEVLTQEQLDQAWHKITKALTVSITPNFNESVPIGPFINEKQPQEGSLESWKSLVAEGSFEELSEEEIRSQGRSLEGFQFLLTDESNPSRTYPAETDKEGHFVFERIPAGTYTLTENLTAEQKKLYKPRYEKITGIRISSGQMTSLPQPDTNPAYATPDNMISSYACVKKELDKTSKGGSVAGFYFNLTNTEDPNVKYRLGPTDSKGLTPTVKVNSGTYTVTEEPKAGYENKTGTLTQRVVPGKTTELGPFVNHTAPTAYVLKTLTADSVDGGPNGFTFTMVSTKNKNLKYTLGPTKTIDGTAGMTEPIEVEPGTYTVTENPRPGYEDRTGAQTITVSEGKPTVIKRSNYNGGGTARIVKKLTKKSVPGGSTKDFSFKLKNVSTGKVYTSQPTKVQPDGTGITSVEKLEYGEYVITEVMTGDQTESYTDETDMKRITLSEEENEKTIEWENTFSPPPAKLQIKKVLSDKSAAGGTVEGFRFSVYKVINGKETKLTAAELGVKESDLITPASGILPEMEVEGGYTYKVVEELTEKQKELYSDITGPLTKTVKPGEVTEFRYTNLKDADATVSIQKVISEGSADDATVEGFRFLVTNTADASKSFTLVTDQNGFASKSGIPYGTYKITEQLTQEQKKSYIDLTGSDTFTLSRTGGKHSHSVTWKNSKPVPQIDLIKTLTKDSGKNGTVEGFTFQFKCTTDPTFPVFTKTTDHYGKIHVEKVNGKAIPYGTYEIREILTPEQAKRYKDETKLISVTIDKNHPGGAGEYTWENRFEDLGEIHLQKEITPRSERARLSGFKFTFKNTNASGKSFTGITDADGKIDIADVPFGTYQVYENLTNEQLKNYTSLSPNPTKITVSENKPQVYLSWLNSYYDDGSIHLKKSLHEDSAEGGTVKDFEFEIRNKDTGELIGSKKTDAEGEFTLDGIPFGTYVVTEKMTRYQGKYYKDLTGSYEVTIDKNTAPKTKEIEWSNRYDRDYYGLTVNKQLVGSEADPDEKFVFHVDIENLDETEEGGRYTAPKYAVYTKAAGGVKINESMQESQEITEDHMRITVNLKGDQCLEVDKLPLGATYRVTEEASDYTPAYEVTQLEGTAQALEGTAVSNHELATGKFECKNVTGNKRTEMTFFNQVPKDDPSNELQIRKQTTDGNTEDSFGYTASLSKLDKNTPYVILLAGSENYTLSISASGGTVKNPSGAGVAGVPVTITRSDDKSKLVRTDRNGAIDLSEISAWMKQKGNRVTVKFLTAEKALDLEGSGVSLTCSDYRIQSFTTDGNGRGSVSFSLKSGQSAYIPGLPGSSKYEVSEEASRYMPSYVISRFDNKSGSVGKLGMDSGESKQPLTTTEEEFQVSRSTIDLVEFTNTTDTTRLKITKESTEENDPTLFDYRVNMSGLSRSSYLAVLPGNESATIETTRSGNIKVTVVNSELFADGDLSGIPVRIIREDKSSRTLYTDSRGRIDAKYYTDWLKEGAKGKASFNYTVEFLDQSIEGTFRNTGDTP